MDTVLDFQEVFGLIQGRTIKNAWSGITAIKESGLGKWALCLGAGSIALYGLVKSRHAVKRKLGFKPKVVAKSPVKNSDFESVRAGSTESKMTPAKCQFMIGDYVNGAYEAVGCGVRIGDWAVFPNHVWSDVSEEPVFYKNDFVSFKKDDVEVFDLDTDLMAIRLKERQWSTIGVSKPTILHFEGSKYVSVVGVRGKGTCGTIKDDAHVFGRLIYLGTTVGGYSGAAYVSGGQLVGMHTSGGAVNGGYSASYVLSLLNQLDRIVDEDSDDFLASAFKSGAAIRVDTTYRDVDEVRLKVRGKYHIMTRAAYNSVLGGVSADEEGYIRSNWRNFGTPESTRTSIVETKNEKMNSVISGPSSSNTTSPEVVGEKRLKLIQRAERLSNEQFKRLLQSLEGCQSASASQVGNRENSSTQA